LVKPPKLEGEIIKNESSLSTREIECLLWLSQGKSIEETAMILSISKKTARTYLDRIKVKLNATKTTQAVYYATKRGLL
jgi:DNA-binding CsgD family transcriptional regulator